MPFVNIIKPYLLCLACVGKVLAAILAGDGQGTAPPAAKEWAAAEQLLFTSPTSDKDNAAVANTYLAATTLPSINQESLSGFERYIAGLGRLSKALRNTEHKWEAQTPASSTAPEAGHQETDEFRDEIQKLFAFAGTIKRLSATIKQKYPDDGETELHDNRRADDPAILSTGEEAVSSKGRDAAFTAAVTDLLRVFDQYFGHQSVKDESEEERRKEESVDSIQVLVETLEALAEAHTNYTAAINAVKTPVAANLSTDDSDRISDSSSLPLNSPSSVNPQGDYATAANITTLSTAEPSPLRPLGWYENQRGLLEVAAHLKAILWAKTLGDDGDNNVPLLHPSLPPSTVSTDAISTSTTSTTTTTTSTTVTPRRRGASHRQQPCLPPFEQIAYRMCILQEMQLKLSWSDAQEFCRERGAELAHDMTVIKTRRFLNDLYGEDGTRSRWPVWVGGRRVKKQTWRWVAEAAAGDLEVPDFLWAPNEPRVYSSDLTPEGVCMVLDGYRRFHGASLPCHLRRRFVCQLLE